MQIELTSWDQTNENQRGPLPDAKNISAGFYLNQPSSLTFEYPKNGKNVSWLITDDLPMVIIRVNGVEPMDGRFIIRNFEIDDADEEPMYKFTAWGYMTELNDAVVYPNVLWEAVTYDPKGDKDRAIRFERIDPVWMIPSDASGKVGEVMNRLINEAKNRGALPKLTKNFNNTQTSNAVSWNSGDIKPKYKAGMPLLAVLQGLVDRGLLDARMDKYELVLRNPGAIGQDYTVSNPNKALFYGRDVAEGSERKIDKTGVFTVVLGVDEKNRVFESEDQNAPRTRWGRRETFKNVGDADTYDEMKERVRNYRQKKGDETIQRTLNWVDTGETGQLIPITGYDLGDKLWLDASPDNGSARESIRVKGFTIEQQDDGRLGGSVIIGNLVSTFNSKIAKRMKEMDYGSAPAGAGGAPPADVSVPNAPTSVGASVSLYMDPSGQNHVLSQVSWTAPTQNTDGSPLIDLYEYQVERNVGALAWMPIGRVDAGVTSMQGGILPQDTTVNFRVRAVDVRGNASAWGTMTAINTTKDTTVPGTPSTPTVTAPLSTLKVVWDGLLSGGGALPTDYLITEIHVSTTNNFTPSTGTWVGTFRGKGTFLLNGLTAGTPYYVKLINVDQTGNRSSASAQGSASATPTLLLGPEIVDSAINAAKLADGAVTTPKIQPEAVTTEKLTVAGFSEQLLANGAMEELAQADNTKPAGFGVNTVAGAGVSAWGTDTTNEDSGDRCTYFTLAASADAGRLYSLRAIPVQPGETYYVSVRVKNSRAAPNANRVEAWTNVNATDVLNPAHGSTTITNILGTETGHTGYTTREGTITVPAGKTWMTIAVRSNAAGDGSGYTTYVDNLIVRKLIGDALIVNLTASKITAGTLSADVLLASKFYTDVSPNARVELDGLGLRAYDDTNKLTVDISSLDGHGTFQDITVSGDSNFGFTDPVTGEGAGQINSDGNASFENLFADALYVGGAAVSDMLNALPRGLIARSSKTTSVNRTATGPGAKVDLYEMSAELENGRIYRIKVDPVTAESSPAGETGGFRVTYTDDGSRPLDGSSAVGIDYQTVGTTAEDSSIKFDRTFQPSSTGLHRFLFQLVHSSGGASDFIRLPQPKTIRFSIEDIGAEPPDTGIDPGASLAQTKTFTYAFDWTAEYNESGSKRSDGKMRVQGSWLGSTYYGMMGFGATKQAAILADLAGYTINWVRFYAYGDYAFESNPITRPISKGHLRIHQHNNTSTTAPATGLVNPGVTGGLAGGQYTWQMGNVLQYKELPLSFAQNLRDNTAKGLRLSVPDMSTWGSGWTTYAEWWGAGHASKYPYIKINATKY